MELTITKGDNSESTLSDDKKRNMLVNAKADKTEHAELNK